MVLQKNIGTEHIINEVRERRAVRNLIEIVWQRQLRFLDQVMHKGEIENSVPTGKMEGKEEGKD